MKIPYGQSNFETVRNGEYLFVDKTRFIAELEEQNSTFQFLIRPRRFGKSLFISMLECYYDLRRREQFDKLFGGLWIAENPTPLRNSFLVLRFSFAAIITSVNKEKLINSFAFEVINSVRDFLNKYREELNNPVLPPEVTDAEQAVKFAISAAEAAGQQITVLIDEYDNFANDLIGTGNRQLYYELLQSEGYVRAFYKALKDGTTRAISRIFITGVSPIMLDDLTSGFNITRNLTTNVKLNQIMGFTEAEIRQIIRLVNAEQYFPLEQLVQDMQRYYNGYLFSPGATERLYNSDMALYFLDCLLQNGSYPDEILDDNVKVDYRKIRQLAFNFKDEALIEQLLKDGSVTSELTSRFTLDAMFETRANFVSLLFYMGMLTIHSVDENQLNFVIPNYVIRTVFWEYFQNQLEPLVDFQRSRLKTAMKQLRREGKATLLVEYLNSILTQISNRDLQKYDEKHFKMILITLFHLDGLYMIHSEPEMEEGYIDIVLSKDPRWAEWITWEWAFELKYLKKSERHRLDEVRAEGCRQLERYLQKKADRVLTAPEHRSAVLTLIGKDEVDLLLWPEEQE